MACMHACGNMCPTRRRAQKQAGRAPTRAFACACALEVACVRQCARAMCHVGLAGQCPCPWGAHPSSVTVRALPATLKNEAPSSSSSGWMARAAQPLGSAKKRDGTGRRAPTAQQREVRPHVVLCSPCRYACCCHGAVAAEPGGRWRRTACNAPPPGPGVAVCGTPGGTPHVALHPGHPHHYFVLTQHQVVVDQSLYGQPIGGRVGQQLLKIGVHHKALHAWGSDPSTTTLITGLMWRPSASVERAPHAQNGDHGKRA